MVKRPLEDNRIIGPFITLESSTGEESSEQSTNDDISFESINELPDSPMLKTYVKEIQKKSGQPEKAVINSDPVEDYMKQLGVWKQAVRGE